MSQSIRQSNLLLSEDWKVAYQSFKQVNFTATDFDSIRAAMVEYIRLNFAEDFNDWVQSSEMIAIIDLLAYLTQSVMFRVDLNARENFLDTAERRESILRLARMLSYTPSRNFPAFGLVKVTKVQTNESILDSDGKNLSGLTIAWNDPTNPNWLEQFILVLNASFNQNNRYGRPYKRGAVSGIKTESYRINTVPGTNVVFPLSLSISGESVNSEIVNIDFNDGGTFFELTPNPFDDFRVLYRNDGNGNNSPNTGFFVALKQGTLAFQDFQFTTAIENALIDIDQTNINNTDVWVQTIDSDGIPRDLWTEVPAIQSSNIIFNDVDNAVRKVYSVITRENDQVSIRFADGRFGDVPAGIIRVWYRQSNGLNYEVKPRDLNNRQISISYLNKTNQTFSIGLTCSLQTTISNSAPAESDADIAVRAPQVYSTQDRMVTGEDYNVFPLRESGLIRKLKSVNRTYSGHSRFIDINDPTGVYQNLSVFSNDGLLYKESDLSFEGVAITDITPENLVSQKIVPLLVGTEFINFYYQLQDFKFAYSTDPQIATIWRQATQSTGISTGFFERQGDPIEVGVDGIGNDRYIRADTLVHLVPLSTPADRGIWVKVSNVVGDGSADGKGLLSDGKGPITINRRLTTPGNSVWIVKDIVPNINSQFSATELTAIVAQLTNHNTFGIGYDPLAKQWYVIESNDLAPRQELFSLDNARNVAKINIDSSWFVRVEVVNGEWQIYTRGIRYVFESVRDVRFYNGSKYTPYDYRAGSAQKDYIRILGTNSIGNSVLGNDQTWAIVGSYVYRDGYIEPRRVQITMLDSDVDGIPDDPTQFEMFEFALHTLFWKKITDFDGYEYFEPVTTIRTYSSEQTMYDDKLNLLTGDVSFSSTSKRFYRFVAELSDGLAGTASGFVEVSDLYRHNPSGTDVISFQWRHYASNDFRIDPAVSNINDMFVLTTQYHTDVLTWLKSGTSAAAPTAPSSETLRTNLVSLDSFKMMSDQMIWNPVKYKYLFGQKASEELRAVLKVVRIPGVALTDNEVKSKIISAIDVYFSIDNWDFGDTFYASEMMAYIHTKLANIISSVVVVPLNEEAKFGNLFDIKCQPDEVFISAATVEDIEIVTVLTDQTIRTGV